MPRPGKQTTERAKDFKGTLRQLLSALRQYKLSLIVVMVFAILSTIFNIAGPKILAKATTALATGWIAKLRGIGSIDFAYIGKILLTLLAMYLCSAAFSFIQGWLMTGLSQKVCYDFRRQISEKINRLPLAYFEKRTVGEVLSRITNDVDTLGQSLNQSVTQLITSITTMIGVLIMMLSISPKMTLIALLILPVSLVLVMLVVRFSQKYFKAQQATLGVVNGQVEEVYSGHNVIKAFNREAAVLEDFNTANDKLFESAWKSQFLSGLMQPIMNFVGNLGYVAVAIVGSIFAANGIITIGDIQAFIQYVRNFTQPIQQLAQVSNMLQSMAAAAERVFEFLNEPEEDQLADPARRADPACIDGQVTFDHVRFGYVPEKTIIHDFSCNVQPGQKVAIVGPTGAGKTTTALAILGLLAAALGVALGVLLTGKTDCVSLGEWTMGPVSILLDGIVGLGFIVLFMKVQRLLDNPVTHLIEAVGRRSLYIFCIHTVELTAVPWYLMVQKYAAAPTKGLWLQYAVSLGSIFLLCEILLRRRDVMLKFFPARRRHFAGHQRYVAKH